MGQDRQRLLTPSMLFIQYVKLLATGHNRSEGLWIFNATLVGFGAAKGIVGFCFVFFYNKMQVYRISLDSLGLKDGACLPP